MTTLATEEQEVTRRRDSESTRANILDAAESVFVERGFAATAMSEIAARANVTKSLIHHHFGSKEALWSEVKHRRVADYSARQLEGLAQGEPNAVRFAEAIRGHFRFLQDNPEWVRLNAWMNLEDEKLSAPAEPKLLQAGIAKIRAGQRSGVLRSDVLPENVIAAFMALCMNRFLVRHSYEHRGTEESRAEDDRYLEDILKIFFEGATPR